MGNIVNMNNNNNNSGLGTTQLAKQQAEIADRIRVAQVDYDFYTAGLPYKSGEIHSANHLYGNGKWKKTVIDLFGAEALKEHGSYFGSKAVDFPLVAFNTEFAKFFNPGEKIIIKDKTGLYHDIQAKVIAVKDKKSILVAVPFKKGSEITNGVIMNESRIKGITEALNRFKQMDSDHKGLTTTHQKKSNIIETPEVANQTIIADSPIKELLKDEKITTKSTTNNNTSPFAAEEQTQSNDFSGNNNKSPYKKALLVFVLTLLAIGVGYAIYVNYKPKNK